MGAATIQEHLLLARVRYYLPQLLVAALAARPDAMALAAVSHTKFP